MRRPDAFLPRFDNDVSWSCCIYFGILIVFNLDSQIHQCTVATAHIGRWRTSAGHDSGTATLIPPRSNMRGGHNTLKDLAVKVKGYQATKVHITRCHLTDMLVVSACALCTISH